MNTLKGKKVHFNDKHLSVELEDGRIISTPLNWYPELKKATIKQIQEYKFINRGTGIEWMELDYHLSIESMIIGKALQKKFVA